MERSDGGRGDYEIWGTWEDLLLACALRRHGLLDWDSVSMEVRKRTRRFPDKLTSQSCQQRYHDLRRRFKAGEDHEDRRTLSDDSAVEKIPWMNELLKLRVAELRREVQGYDVSIVSLQSKLKSLTEEDRLRKSVVGRRDSVTAVDGNDEEEGKMENPVVVRKGGNVTDSDGNDELEKRRGGDEEEGERRDRPVSSPADVAAGELLGDSCNESNSPQPKVEPSEPGPWPEPQPEDVKPETESPNPVTRVEHKIAGEGSFNGSTESLAKLRNAEEEEVEKAEKVFSRRLDSGESIAESMGGGGEALKENSDVQSSASLSKRKRRPWTKISFSGGSSGGCDSHEADEVSPISSNRDHENGNNLEKSQPLAVFLKLIRSHKDCSIFKRRLEAQETASFRSLIRQHVDLEMIRTKLEGAGFYNTVEFFRDLLLLCNNAIVFFSKDSLEYTTAVDFREHVKKELAANINAGTTTTTTTTTTVEKKTKTKAATTTKKKNKPPISPPTEPHPSSTAPTKPPMTKSKSESDADDPVIEKTKRTSVSSKAASASAAASAEKEEDKRKKPDLEKELEDVDKKKRERPVARGLRTTKARGASIKKRVNGEVDGDSSKEPTKPAEKKTNGGGGSGEAAISAAKKRSAVSFLDRLNNTPTLSPPSDSGSMPQMLKNAGSGRGEQKKKGGKSEKKKAQGGGGVRQSGGRNKQAVAAEEESTPTKRSVGRPPKKPPPTRTAQTPSKRAREAEREALPQSSPARNKKRGKR